MTSHGRKCILQVEDDEADIFLLQYAFEKAGIPNPVHTVANGMTAIDYLAGTGQYTNRGRYPEPCLVLLDLKLPKIDGFGVLEWIRKQPALKNLVVVVFSSSPLAGDRERAYRLGANSYIVKPTSLEELKEIAEFLKGWWLGFNHYDPIFAQPLPDGPPKTKLTPLHLGHPQMKLRAIVFEDEPTMLQFYQIVLEQRGYETFLYQHPGLCPLNVADGCPCPAGTCCADLIISDLQMPGAYGLDYIEELQRKKCRQAHIAIISGSWTEEARERAARIGCKTFSKPVQIPELTAWLEEIEKTVPPERRLFNWG